MGQDCVSDGLNTATQKVEHPLVVFRPLVSENIPTLGNSRVATALAKAQADFPSIPKDKTATVRSERTGTQYSYKYADLADILKLILPILSRHELALSQPLRRRDGKLYLTTELIHSSGEMLVSSGLEMRELGATPQQFGSELTYWRRYDLCALLGIAPEEDVDAQGLQQRSKARQNPPLPAKPGGLVLPVAMTKDDTAKSIEASPQPEKVPAVEVPKDTQAGADEPQPATHKEKADAIITVLKTEGLFSKRPGAHLKSAVARMGGKQKFEELDMDRARELVDVLYVRMKLEGEAALIETVAELLGGAARQGA